MGYSAESQRLFKSVRTYATDIGRDFDEVVRELEEGFFFFDPEDRAYSRHVQSILNTGAFDEFNVPEVAGTGGSKILIPD